MIGKQHSSIIQIIRTLLIVLWVYAAVSKLSDYNLFAEQLKRQPLPESTDAAIAIILPTIEIAAAILLLFDRTLKTGYKGSFILMSLFTLYVLLAMTRAFGHIPCPCAGIIGRMPWTPHLVFNIFFTIVSYAGYYLQKHMNKNNKTVYQKHYLRINRQTT